MKKFTFLFFIILSISLQAQITNEIQEITANNLSEDDRFGYCTAINNDFAFLGSPGDDENGTNAGALYLFSNSAGTWTETEKLVSSDIAEGDFFGYVVATYGDYAFISTPIKNSYQGAVYVFKNNSGTWTETQKLMASDAEDNDYFGYSIDIQGDYAIIGAYGEDDVASDAGAVYIFKNNSGTWSEVQKITASNGAANNHYGKTVAIYGDYAVVGSPDGNYNNVETGTAYVLKNNSGTWQEHEEIVSTDIALGDHFGASVSIFDNTLLVGANYKNYGSFSWAGASYVFENISDSWTQKTKLTATNAGEYKHFGGDVQIYENSIIIGAKGEVSFEPHIEGSAYIFNKNAETWSQTAKIESTNNTIDDVFGNSVSISDKHIIVGAEMSGLIANNAGAVYSFDVFPTEIISQPNSQTADIGDNVNFSVTAKGTNLSYQWQKNGTDLSDDTNISGSTTNELSINSLVGDDAGTYICIVSGNFGNETSNNAILSINGTDINVVSENKISIYPNPTTGILNFDVQKSFGCFEVEITDITGNIINNYQLTINNSEIDISNFPNGVYFVKIISENNIIVKKIVKN